MRRRACIVKRGDKWSVKQPLPDGRYHWRTVGTRKKDAEALRDELNRRAVLGAAYQAEPLTFGTFKQRWLAAYEQRSRPSSVESVKASLAHLEHLDDTLIELITAAELEEQVTAVARSTPRRAQLVLRAAKQVLRSAKERGQVVDEAILGLKPPRVEQTERRFLSWDEVDRLACETMEPHGNLVRLACLTGLRQGELFALRDTAVDLRDRTLLVEASASEGKLVPTKTRAGRRRVHLPGEAVRILRAQMLAREPNELGLVFPNSVGGLLRRNDFMHRVFRPALRRAKLEPLRFHDLRHTYAALMVAAGAHPKLLQAQMGHTSIAITLDLYGHLYPDAFADVGAQLDELVRASVSGGVAQGSQGG
jgi:integrase